MRALVVFLAGVIAAGSLPAQAPKPAAVPDNLTFEVATLKASAPGGRGGAIRPAPGGERYVANNAPLRLMIAVAYQIKADQIQGGPDWIATVPFDMNAKAAQTSSVDELRMMLRNLLAERFQLKFHRESKELPVYALTVDKSGPKLKEHPFQNAGEPWIEETSEKPLHMKMSARSVTMKYFAFRLSQVLDRPVVDQTSLSGDYDFELSYTRDLPHALPPNAMLNGEPIDTSGPSIFAAVLQQLGLKLESKKAPVSLLVIDHVEMPSGN